jgi:hypothetical protein
MGLIRTCAASACRSGRGSSGEAGGQAAAGVVTGHHHAVEVEAEFGGVLAGGGGEGVFRGGREGFGRRQRVATDSTTASASRMTAAT